MSQSGAITSKAGLAVLSLALAAAAVVDGLSLNFERVTAGRGRLAGQGYTLSGVVGLAEGAPLAGGGYSLAGWPAAAPAAERRLLLPYVARQACPESIAEREPNNLMSQANVLGCARQQVSGAHDGDAGTGDVFRLYLRTGQALSAALSTSQPVGVQLILYRQSSSGLTQLQQAPAAPFSIQHTVAADAWHYLYVYTALERPNMGAYTLVVEATGP